MTSRFNYVVDIEEVRGKRGKEIRTRVMTLARGCELNRVCY